MKEIEFNSKRAKGGKGADISSYIQSEIDRHWKIKEKELEHMFKKRQAKGEKDFVTVVKRSEQSNNNATRVKENKISFRHNFIYTRFE